MKIRTKLTKSVKSALRKALLDFVSLDEIADSLKGDFCRYPTLAEKIATPEAPNMKFVPEATAVQAQHYSTPDIFTLDLHDIYFCPEHDILYTKSRQLIKESISTQRDLSEFDFKAFYPKSEIKITEACSTFRSRKNGYYHTLIDNLPRLYLLHHSKFREIKEIKILCSSQPTVVEQFYLDKLLPKNAHIERVDNNTRYLLKNLIFPSFLSRRFSGCLPSEYRTWFINKVAPKRPRKIGNRIFISRIATHKGRQRCILNEDELFGALKPYGFQKYVLEQLSIEEQIELFYDAEAVVAAHGAGLTNMLFSKKIKIIELFPSTFILPHYYFLAKSLGHHYQYWCAENQGLSGNFTADTAGILKMFECFGEH